MLLPSTALAAWASVFLLTGASCSTSDGGSATNGGNAGSSGEEEPSGTLMVFAASSLTDAFEELEKKFESTYPKVDVKLNFAGSQSLRTQIQNGARAQVFASANAKHMEALAEQNLVERHVTFAENKMVVVVPKGNPAAMTSFGDLTKATRLVLADENVPAGAYAAEVLRLASEQLGAERGKAVDGSIVSRENHVRQTLQKVVLGEADAAMVYATDASSAKGGLSTIDIPEAYNIRATYPIAVLSNAKRAHLGKLFVEYTLSAPGQDVLSSFGFQPPLASAQTARSQPQPRSETIE